ncbi:plasmid replication protein, CyRepA1 family [Acaryochloris marina]|uniref:plasmid replication protein, CyRepA1 family n=1 Tax=Acaryochloris marina TaxID=155978 RepID=UPI001BAF9C8E|nr:plasmid replication protein, CyRepA1 family [Acaryochloris marina]QUY40304.1 hypothetical protein I1H34_00355 [Acaryochloris marina S15]
MPSFHRYSNRNGNICPICNGSRGKPDCRKSFNPSDAEDSGIYFCRGTDTQSGYHFVGFDTNGFGMFVTETARNAQSQDQWQKKNLERQARQEAERQAKLAKLLPTPERDRHFRRIATNAGLGSRHRQHLQEKRELTNEQIDIAIEQNLFWTWQDNAQIPGLPLNLPGINPSTGKLRKYYQGMGIAIPNVHGEIVGAQIKPDFGSNYFWVSSDSDKLDIPGAGPHLPNGEQPIAVHKVSGSTTVGLVDSVTFKPFLASQRLGISFIGAAGNNFASSPETLKETLDELAPETIIFYPDAGDISNPHITKAIEKTVTLVEEWGYNLIVAWWGQVSYDDDCDIDELPLDQIDQIQHLTPTAYLQLAQAAIQDQWRIQQEKQARKTWDKSRQYTPTQIIDEQWFTANPQDLAEADIYALKSAMGTGKTEWLRQYFDSVDIGAVAIGHRNSLLLQSCERWPNFYHLHSDSAHQLVADPHSRIACCIDSLSRFEDKDFEGKVLVLDESLSVVLHSLMSGTLIGRRDHCLAKLQSAIESAALVIPMDGNNSDVVVDYLAQLRGGGKVVKVLNTFQRKTLRIELLDKTYTSKGKAIDERSPVLQLALDTLVSLDQSPEHCARSIVLFSDSQRQCQIAEEIFEMHGYSTLRVDSKTSASTEVKDFLKDPDAYLEETQPRVLIYSPTAESGLSVGIKNYFYKGFGLFFGVLPISSMTQMMQRVRDLGEIAIWCRKYAFSEEYDGNRSPFPKRVRELMMDYIQADAIASMTGTDREAATQQWFQKLLQALDDPHLTTHNILAAALNYEQQHTWDCLKAVLIEAGHHVAIIDKLQSDHLKAQSTEIRERILDTDAATIYDAKDITMEAAIRIKSRWSSSLDERWSCEKAFLQHRLPGIQLTEIWGPELIKELLFKNRTLIPSLERWWLLNHMDAAQERSRTRWEQLMEQEQSPFLPDIRSDFAMLQAMQDIGLLRLFEGETALNENSELIQEIYKKCKRRKISTALRRRVGRQGSMEFVARLAKLIGGTTQAEQSWVRDENRGKRSYLFHPPEINEVKTVLLACIDQRLNKYCSESAETTDSKGEEAATAIAQNCIDIGDVVANKMDLDPLDDVESVTSENEVIPFPLNSSSVPIERGNVVCRTSDGSRFRVKSITDGRAWLQWLDQFSPKVDILVPLEELELLPGPGIRGSYRSNEQFPGATG